MAKKGTTKAAGTYQFNLDAATDMINHIKAGKGWALANKCTGSGKTFVMKEAVKQLSSKKVMVIGPSLAVLWEVEKTLKSLPTTINYMTYQKLCRIQAMPTGINCIIFDEAHRMGAPVWKQACYNLANVNPNANVLGFTGTVERGDGENISETIFPGIATELTYGDAFKKNIIPHPSIVNVYYTTVGTLSAQLKSKLQKVGIKNPTHIEAEKAAEKLILDWSRIKIEEDKIIQKHLPKDTKKIIVFFESISDLQFYKPEVEGWFVRAGFNPIMLELHNRLTKKQLTSQWKVINQSVSPGNILVILSVNMLNEGTHIPDVESVMFLRRSESPSVILQQLGRCLRVGQKRRSVVFDFVGNTSKIKFQAAPSSNLNVSSPTIPISTNQIVSAVGSTSGSGGNTSDEEDELQEAGGTGGNITSGGNNTTKSNNNNIPKFATDLEVYEYGLTPAKIQQFNTVLNSLANPNKPIEELLGLINAGDVKGYLNNPSLREFVRKNKSKCNEAATMQRMVNDYQSRPENYLRPNCYEAYYVTKDYSKLTKSDVAWLYNHNGKAGYYYYPIVKKILKEYNEYKKQQRNKK